MGETKPPRTIFILGAPRTGSTFLYQALCSQFHLPYIANITNDFYNGAPIVGLAVQRGVPVRICFESSYGKTQGAFQPSEASAIMARWFGGGHPSAVVSTQILEGMEHQFFRTIAAAEGLFGAPLVIKNAWNCFRVRYLAGALPEARFVWIRRDIAAAAKSDLVARYETKGSSERWNSATPGNVECLQKLPAAAQVIENQHEFNMAVAEAFEYARGRTHEVWYEDLINTPDSVLESTGAFLRVPSVGGAQPIIIAPPKLPKLSGADNNAIDVYLADHVERFSLDRYPAFR